MALFQADLIITDMAMSEMNSYEFVRQVRPDYTQDLPVIVASASSKKTSKHQ